METLLLEGFPELLKAHRTDMGLTQGQLADEWGYSTETISAWERGKRNPRRQQIPRLAQQLNMTTQELMQSMKASSEKNEGSNNQAQATDGIQQATIVTEYPNQKACEMQISEESFSAKQVKILTIRGEKYFGGSKGILYHLGISKGIDSPSVKVLVLSPEAEHINEDLAVKIEDAIPKVV